MFQWCSFCQKFISETEPVENLAITHGICPECREKPKTETTVSQIKPSTQFFNELRKHPADFSKINLDVVIKKAQSLDIKASDLFIGILQPLITKITDKPTIEQPEQALEFNQYTTLVTSKIKKHYDLENKYSTNIVCISSAHNYSYASIRYFEICLRQENLSTHTLSTLTEDDFIQELETLSPKVIVFSVWSAEETNKVLNYISRYSKADTPPLIVFDFAEARPLELPSFAIGFNGDVAEMLNTIRNHMGQ